MFNPIVRLQINRFVSYRILCLGAVICNINTIGFVLIYMHVMLLLRVVHAFIRRPWTKMDATVQVTQLNHILVLLFVRFAEMAVIAHVLVIVILSATRESIIVPGWSTLYGEKSG